MRLKQIEISGFRGFREKFCLNFSSGFTVISGRNGVGKSTICDAIEFVISGDISKFRIEKSDRESYSDYIWWRGDGEPIEHFVKLILVDEAGESHEVIRTREEGLQCSDEQLLNFLCTPDEGMDSQLAQLCKTSIIRDEWISAQSLDLMETERFKNTSSALGGVDTKDLLERIKKVKSVIDIEIFDLKKAHSNAQIKLEVAQEDLNKSQSLIRATSDVSQAANQLSKYISNLPDEIPGVIATADNYIEALRQKVTTLVELEPEVVSYIEDKETIYSESYIKEKDRLSSQLAELLENEKTVNLRLIEAKRVLEIEELSDSVSAALSKIIEGGEILGLNNGHCPLCNSERDKAEFEEGLKLARNRVGELGEKISKARDRVATEEGALNKLNEDIKVIIDEQAKFNSKELILKERLKRLKELIDKYDVDEKNIEDWDEYSKLIQKTRSDLIDVERILSALKGSQHISKINDQKLILEKLKNDSEKLRIELERKNRAAKLAKDFDHTIKRTGSEISDERLFKISPLLNELYQRLRPHPDWDSIDYNIRGDVQKFLSLKIGEDLNPQFIFSSGQRRAAGLAFLLSVYLSRPWCRLKTLILDDPVQHIDDYRAIHLVELMAALRKSDHQIVCTVEDKSLATLMTRRLISTHNYQGLNVRLNRDGPGDIKVIEKRIPPFENNTLMAS